MTMRNGGKRPGGTAGRRVPAGAGVIVLAGLIAGCATFVPHPARRAGAPSVASARARQPSRIAGPRPEVIDLARRALDCAVARGEIETSVLTVIDYSLPSTTPRLWVIDLATGAVLFHELVAHGRNSGENRAVSFSNLPGSKQSSLGLFRTEETYWGRHGYSLRLAGLEPGFNDRARRRAIVMHGADYATREFAQRHGRLGRSWGCPAVDPEVHERLIDTIKDGTALFAFYPDPDWMDRSRFLDCRRAS